MRPYVIVNAAMTADGKIDTYERRGSAISSAEDLERVLRMRSESDAVMVGGNTLIHEDPKLTVKREALRSERIAKGWSEEPIKVGIVSRADLKPDSDFLNAGKGRKIIFTTKKTDEAMIRSLSDRGAEVFLLGNDRVDLIGALEKLSVLGVARLMVEGGGTLIFEMLKLHLVDEINLYLAPLVFGGASAPTLAEGSGLIRSEAIHLHLKDLKVYDESGGVLLRYEVK